MATSGSTDFNMTASEVVKEAFGRLGILEAETPLQAFEIADGILALNLFLKTVQISAPHLWTKTEGVLFLEPSQAKYLLGSDRATRADDFISTTLSADAAISATSLSLTSTTGMALNDPIGVELDDGTRHWTTIDTIPVAGSITIADGLASAATAGISIYTYTNLLEKPLRIDDYARRQTFGQNNEIEITKMARRDYFTQVDKVSTGTVTGFYYSPQRDNGEFYIWQPVSTVTQLLKFTFQRSIEDIDSNTNNLDINTEWLETVIISVAATLLDKYDVPPIKAQSILGKAAAFTQALLDWDNEDNDLEIQPWVE